MSDDPIQTNPINPQDDNPISGGTSDDSGAPVKTGTNPDAPKYPGQFWPSPGESGYDTSMDPNHDDFFVKPLPVDLKMQIHDEYYKSFSSLPEEKRKSKVNIPPHPDTDFDDDYFVWLLGKSISLNPKEKEDIISKIDELSQFQIDELLKIFEEEKYKFMIINVKNNNAFNNYAKQQSSAWDMELQKKEFEQQTENDKAKLQELSSMLNFATKYQCTNCKWIYEVEFGYPQGSIAPGTLWNDVPETWVCPQCSATKDQFVEVE